MSLSDRSSSDGGRDRRSPRDQRRRTRSRSRNRYRNNSRDRSLSPDSFGPKLPRPRNREREREERDRRFREAKNIRRIRISPHRSRSRSRSRSRERHNNHWPDQRDGLGKHGSFRDEYYYDQQRDDEQRQRQEAFVARYKHIRFIIYKIINWITSPPPTTIIHVLLYRAYITEPFWFTDKQLCFFWYFCRRLQERERIGESGCPEVWGYSPRVKEPEWVRNFPYTTLTESSALTYVSVRIGYENNIFYCFCQLWWIYTGRRWEKRQFRIKLRR